MCKRISFDVKEKMVSLTGACFWFWNSFYSFLDASGVPSSLYLRFPKTAYNKYDVMRNVLSALEEQGRFDAINSIVSNFYRLRTAVDRDDRDCQKATVLLDEFRKAVGSDPIENEIQRRKVEEARQEYEAQVQRHAGAAAELAKLNNRFSDLASLKNVTPQQRGFELERLFFDLLQLSEFDCKPPYRTSDGEQIDGQFKYEKFDYLVEVKWNSGLTKQPDLSIFDGKIRGKAQSTRGLFVAAEGFDPKAVAKYSGDSPRIVFMTGADLVVVLNGTTTQFDLMKLKVDALVRHGRVLEHFGRNA